MKDYGNDYKKEDWIKFIDSSKTSLKDEYNRNTYTLLPFADSVSMKENLIINL